MKITDYDFPKVRIVENFLSKEDCDWFIDYANLKNAWSLSNATRKNFTDENHFMQVSRQWNDRKIDFNTLYQQKKEPELFSKIWEVKNKAKDQVSNFFNIDVNSFWLESWEAVRWYYPYHQTAHIDYIDVDFDRSKLPEGYDSSFFTEEEESLYRKHCTTKHYTGMIYMNDNFDGGELYFPYHNNFEIKPKPGMLVIFSGNIFNPHGIRPITSGTRYVHTTFWTKSPTDWHFVAQDEINNKTDKFWEKEFPL